MPIYEYRCESCGHRLEALQKMSDAPLSECPHCHAPQLKKLMSAGTTHQIKESGGCGDGPMPGCGGGVCPACH